MEKMSIVIPVYNEEKNIRPLTDQINKALQHSGIKYEIIFVDDGSEDHTVTEIKSIIARNITLIELKRNFGQTAAIKAGIDHADGDYIATLDGDMQNDPYDLLMMLDVLRQKDCDIVTGIRANRADDFILRKIPSYLANFMVRKVTRTNIKDNGCGIKVFRSDILKELSLYGERHRFMASLAVLDGATIEQVEVKHHPRVHGKSKYGLGRTLKVISDLILMNFSRKYSQKPMYLFGTVGVITSIAGAIILLYLLIQKIMGQDIWGRPIMILGVLLIFIGFQIISTGLILDLVIRNEYESNRSKPYKIKRVKRAE
ncbi:MAG TPA: glycosyltransferase family 2 protein [Bacteroidales bacterium]|nr:glycosyltransferase family 2 protein [Bacteroidales bacterium]